MMQHFQLDIALRLTLSAVLGGLIGLERERLEWVAGLRTHMLVCLGAALFMIVSAYGFADVLGHSNVTLDPSRVAAQVVSGIGFLGAGTILFLRQEIIRGLTTAASLWTVAAIGLAVGGGLYSAAITTTALVLVILALVKPLEQRIFGKDRVRVLALTVQRGATALDQIERLLDEEGLRVRQFVVQRSAEPELDRIDIVLKRGARRNALLAATSRLQTLDGVHTIGF